MLKSTAEDILNREFYAFYRKTRRGYSKKIKQYNYFHKAIGGMMIELRRLMEEAEDGVHLRGLGVIHKKPYGELTIKMGMFKKRFTKRQLTRFFLEDDYLRAKYYIKKLMLPKKRNKKTTNPEALLLHRKLIKKNT
jgi:cobalamin biosynthesis Co2+ chelatase CbiK